MASVRARPGPISSRTGASGYEILVSRAAPRSAGRATAAALHLGTTLGTALTQRGITAAEARAYAGFGVFCLLFAAVVFWWPRALSYTAAVAAGHVGIALLVRAWRLWRGKSR
jgi:cardiolipin synthase